MEEKGGLKSGKDRFAAGDAAGKALQDPNEDLSMDTRTGNTKRSREADDEFQKSSDQDENDSDSREETMENVEWD